MEFTFQEVLDLNQAIIDAQAQLRVDPRGKRFSEITAYYDRLEALSKRLREYIINH